jgi:hypothetical protein
MAIKKPNKINTPDRYAPGDFFVGLDAICVLS